MDARGSLNKLLRKEALILGMFSVLLGTLLRTVMSWVMFLQADEEIFSYDAYYILLGRSFDFILRKIGAYIGYPAALSIWYRIFGVSLFSARMFSVLCSMIMLIFVFLTLKKLTNNPRMAMLGTLLLSLLPFPLRYGHIVLTEPFAWAIISCGLFFLIKGMKEDRWVMILLSGMICAPAFFIRRSALILPIVIFPTLLWVNRHHFRRMLKETFSWLGGFLIPFAGGLMFFILYIGWDRLEELRWTRIPNITPEWSLDLQGFNNYEYALYTLQPTVWKGTFLVIVVMIGTLILLMSIFKDRWKAVYLAAFLWPAFMRLTFETHLDSLELARITVLPLVVLFIGRGFKADHRFYLVLSLLLGSTIGFSTVQLSGDIWNVILYVSVAGIFLVYLADRLESRLLSLILMGGGIVSLFIITFKEPQIENLVRFILPVSAMVYGLSLVLTRKAPGELTLTVLGLFIPMMLLDPELHYWEILIAGFAVLMGLIPLMHSINERKWARIRFAYPLIAICSAFFIPAGMPDWGVYLPLLGMTLFMVSYFIESEILGKLSRIVPITGAVAAFSMAYYATRSVTLSALAAVLVGSTATMLKQLDRVSLIWREKVGEKISVLLFMLIVGYIAFYIYYAWTEVYLTEFLFQAVILGGLLLWMLKGTHPSIRIERIGGSYRKTIIPFRIRRSASAMFILFLVISIPVSVGFYLEDSWFKEQSMDKRPYMRTIRGVSDWIEDNTDENEFILAWHCYAIQADRETVIEVSNAQIYNGRLVIRDMEAKNVSVFVRDWYVDFGIWRDQPVFQEYILSNFVIDRVIDGNECWIRVE